VSRDKLVVLPDEPQVDHPQQDAHRTAGARPVPHGWPDEFDPEAAEAVIASAHEVGRDATDVILSLVVELEWAIAQLRAEREERP
jgi:hypothetical protein